MDFILSFNLIGFSLIISISVEINSPLVLIVCKNIFIVLNLGTGIKVIKKIINSFV